MSFVRAGQPQRRHASQYFPVIPLKKNNNTSQMRSIRTNKRPGLLFGKIQYNGNSEGIWIKSIAHNHFDRLLDSWNKRLPLISIFTSFVLSFVRSMDCLIGSSMNRWATRTSDAPTSQMIWLTIALRVSESGINICINICIQQPTADEKEKKMKYSTETEQEC